MGDVCFKAPDSPKGKKTRFIAFCVGLLLWALALVLFCHALQIRKLPTTEAVVSSVFRNSKITQVYVQYELGGQSYTTYFSNSKSYRTGDRVTIAYDPDFPEQIYERGRSLDSIFFFLFLVGLVLFWISQYPQRALRALGTGTKGKKAAGDR